MTSPYLSALCPAGFRKSAGELPGSADPAWTDAIMPDGSIDPSVFVDNDGLNIIEGGREALKADNVDYFKNLGQQVVAAKKDPTGRIGMLMRYAPAAEALLEPDPVARKEKLRTYMQTPGFKQDVMPQLQTLAGDVLGEMPWADKLSLLGPASGISLLKSAPTESSPYMQKLLWGVLGGYGGTGMGDYFNNLLSAVGGHVPSTYARTLQAQGAQPQPKVPAAPAAPAAGQSAGGTMPVPAPAPAPIPSPTGMPKASPAPPVPSVPGPASTAPASVAPAPQPMKPLVPPAVP